MDVSDVYIVRRGYNIIFSVIAQAQQTMWLYYIMCSNKTTNKDNDKRLSLASSVTLPT